MHNTWTVRSAVVAGLVLAGLMFVGPQRSAHARAGYLSTFRKEYKKLAPQVKKVKCNVCHYRKGKEKKLRNDFGKALEKHLGKIDKKKGERDKKKILKALKKAEKEKSSTKDKTFGDLIKAGKLPGKTPEDADKKKEKKKK